jgi:hypothetical protein
MLDINSFRRDKAKYIQVFFLLRVKKFIVFIFMEEVWFLCFLLSVVINILWLILSYFIQQEHIKNTLYDKQFI